MPDDDAAPFIDGRILDQVINNSVHSSVLCGDGAPFLGAGLDLAGLGEMRVVMTSVRSGRSESMAPL